MDRRQEARAAAVSEERLAQFQDHQATAAANAV